MKCSEVFLIFWHMPYRHCRHLRIFLLILSHIFFLCTASCRSNHKSRPGQSKSFISCTSYFYDVLLSQRDNSCLKSSCLFQLLCQLETEQFLIALFTIFSFSFTLKYIISSYFLYYKNLHSEFLLAIKIHI